MHEHHHGNDRDQNYRRHKGLGFRAGGAGAPHGRENRSVENHRQHQVDQEPSQDSEAEEITMLELLYGVSVEELTGDSEVEEEITMLELLYGVSVIEAGLLLGPEDGLDEE